jgi:catechol 2,3-dioxygenase-like lactoylglutathione lyase family enzyme
MLTKVHHTGITVTDYKRSMDFYCGILGMEVVFEAKLEGNRAAAAVFKTDDHAVTVAMLAVPADLGGGMVELFHFERPKPEPAPPHTPWQPGWTHICLTTNDIEGSYARLRERGVRFTSPPIEFTAEGVTMVTAPRLAGPGSGRSVITYFYDPDGVLIELAQFS